MQSLPAAAPAQGGAPPRRHAVVPSPVGDLVVVEDEAGALVALRLGDPARPEDGERDDAAAPAAVAQLQEYFAGTRTRFDLALAPVGTPFQQRVWRLLQEIPYGETRSYGELAAALGQPGASRAVGLANARNPIGVVVPCHRVIGASGTLTGYAGGLPRKRWLLDHERGALPLGPLG